MRNTKYDIRLSAEALAKAGNTLSTFVLLLAVLICAGTAYAQPELTAEVSEEEIHVGDRIELDVTAPVKKDMDLEFPEMLENTGEFRLLGSSPLKKGWGSSKREGRVYIMSVYTTGTQVIPPIPVRYKAEGSGEWKVAESPQVPVEINSLLSGFDSELRDIKGLINLGREIPWLIIAILILIVGGSVGWILWKNKDALLAGRKAKRRSAYEIAYDELHELKKRNLPEKGLIKEYYSRLSDIVRHYLENRFFIRAPEMTTEEFMEKVKGSPRLVEAHKALLKDFLSHCDMVKFAKYGPTPLETIDSYKSAEKLVEETKPEEEEEEEDA
jgi:hypothetical protein